MKTLAIETSCDETGFALVDFNDQESARIVDNQLASQIDEHQEYGGVYPSLAKRLHAQNLPALLDRLRKNVRTKSIKLTDDHKTLIREWLKRQPELAAYILEIAQDGLPDVDNIAVTIGPGLAPALWVGVNVARSLALLLDVPLVAVNHMAGHLMSAAATIDENNLHISSVELPAVCLLASGGHTELIQITKNQLKKIGQTRDDAAGEAFDKIGRELGFDYPAGPAVSQAAKSGKLNEKFQLPRPMIDSDNMEFSFSGMKTAAVRLLKKHGPLNAQETSDFSKELETAIVDLLYTKTKKAAKSTKANTILAGGGVTANQKLRSTLQSLENELSTSVKRTPASLSTDNALMIALAAYHPLVKSTRHTLATDELAALEADSRLSL